MKILIWDTGKIYFIEIDPKSPPDWWGTYPEE